MKLRWMASCAALVTLAALSPIAAAQGSSAAPSPSSPASAKPVKKVAPPADSGIESGAVTNGVYRNKALLLSCKIPPGWVLRSDEMNVRDESPADNKEKNEAN